MKSIVSFLLFGALVAGTGVGCTKKVSSVNQGTTNLSLLALGDSYTIGELVGESERFASQTAVLLKQDKINMDPITYVAKTGWRTDEILAAIDAASLESKYNLVTLLAGVNDQFQDVDTATYRTHFTSLVERAIHYAGDDAAHVFVLSMPDYGVTPSVPTSEKAAVAQEIDNFNAINRDIASAHGCVYVDITPTTRLMMDDSSLIAPDGLHPSGKEYAQWATLLAPLIHERVK